MSQIKVQCPGCGRRYAAPESRAGSSLNCLTCATPIPIPSPTLGDPLGHDALSQIDYAPQNVPASHYAPAASSEGFPLAAKIAIGVGAAVLFGLLFAIVLLSFTGSGDTPVVATAAAGATAEAAGQQASGSAPGDPRPRPASMSNAGSSRRPADISYYENNHWTLKKDIAGRFSQWFPAGVETRSQKLRGTRIESLTATVSNSEACTMFFMVNDGELPGDPVEAVERKLDEQLPRGAVIVSKQWKQERGQRFLEVKASNERTNVLVFNRFYSGSRWMVVLTWQVRRSARVEESKIGKFLDGFAVE